MTNLFDFIQSTLYGIFPHPDITGFYGNSTTIYLSIYIIIILMTLLVCFVKPLQTYFNPYLIHFYPGWRNYFFSLLIFTFLMISFIQISMHAEYFSGRYALLGDSGINFHTDFPSVADFSQGCHQFFKNERLKGKLITDLDITDDPGMIMRNEFAYLVYPTINIRSYDQQEEPDCLVYFYKFNAERFIPDGYEVQYKFDEENMIVMKKKSDGNF